MAHFLTSDEKYCDLIHEDDYRSYLINRVDSPTGYRFGRTQGRRVRTRSALRRVNGYFKAVIEAIASAKLRRLECELELRDIRVDRPNNNWVARNSARSGVRED
jgi:hypothetical protein